MRITDVEAIVVVWPPPERPFRSALRTAGFGNELVVRIHTDEGHVGLGEAHALEEPLRPLYERAQDGSLEAAGSARVVTDIMKPMLIGEDPLDNERIWEELFGLTYRPGWLEHRRTRYELLCALAGVDTALWDLKGKAAGMPIYKLLGGSRSVVECYATCGYYRDGRTDDDVVEECVELASTGYRAMKLKLWGLTVEEDMGRIAKVRSALGDGVDIMVDFNESYDVETAIRAARMLEPLGIRWIEEPVRWYDAIRGLGRVATATEIPVASGERAYHRWEARDLIELGGVKVMQFDPTRSAGITEFLKIAGMCAMHDVRIAPHHDPQMNGHLVAALPNGDIQESFPSAERDPIWHELFRIRPEIINGELHLLDRPGWGFEIDEDVLAERGLPTT